MKIKLNEIEVNGFNRSVKKDHVESLAQSIKTIGLLEPIIVTASFPDLLKDKHHVLLVAGLHRFKAAQLLKWPDIEVEHKKFDSMDDLMAACAAENQVRRDTFPWEDAVLLQKIFKVDDPPKTEEVAAALGRSKDWVIRRRRLVNLTKKMLTAWQKHPTFAIEFMEIAALLPPIIQDGSINDFGESNPHLILEWMRRQGGNLTNAPWPVGKPGYGPKDCINVFCDICKFNTANGKELFTAAGLKEVGKQVCTNQDCFNLKWEAWVNEKIQAFQKENPKGLILSTSYRVQEGIYRASQWAKAAETAPEALPGLLVDGPQIGTVIYAKLITQKAVTQQAKEPEAKPKTEKAKAEDRKVMLQNKRDTHMVVALLAQIEQGNYRTFSLKLKPEHIVFMAATFGTITNERYADGKDFTKDWEDTAELALWDNVAPVLQSRWNIHNMKQDCPKIVPEVRAFAKLIGFDLKSLDTTAENANPIPKSWK